MRPVNGETVPSLQREDRGAVAILTLLENRNAELRQLEHEIGHLGGQIQTAGGEGVGEA